MAFLSAFVGTVAGALLTRPDDSMLVLGSGPPACSQAQAARREEGRRCLAAGDGAWRSAQVAPGPAALALELAARATLRRAADLVLVERRRAPLQGGWYPSQLPEGFGELESLIGPKLTVLERRAWLRRRAAAARRVGPPRGLQDLRRVPELELELGMPEERVVEAYGPPYPDVRRPPPPHDQESAWATYRSESITIVYDHRRRVDALTAHFEPALQTDGCDRLGSGSRERLWGEVGRDWRVEEALEWLGPPLGAEERHGWLQLGYGGPGWRLTLTFDLGVGARLVWLELRAHYR